MRSKNSSNDALNRGKTSEEATKDIILNQLPEIVRLNASGDLSVENIDVFCEEGVFNVDEVRLPF